MRLETIQTVAVISDTHGYLNQDIAGVIERCDIAVHAGDVGNAEVIQTMRPKSGKVYLIKGNNDVASKWPVEQKSVLAQLQERIALDLPGGQLVVTHGHKQNPVAARHALLRKLYATARLIVYGHSHRLCIDQEHTPWVINPGAAGKARTYGGASCVVLHVSHDHWHMDTIRVTDA
jgi:putative phosphoesterase